MSAKVSGALPAGRFFFLWKGQTATKEREALKSKKSLPRSKPLVRTVVATTKNSEEFGKMVGAEAMRRGFFGALRKVVLGDGGVWIWNLATLHFVGFTPILDFLHPLTHLYAAAEAAHRGEPLKVWKLYEKFVRLAWGGKVAEVLEALAKEAKRAGKPPKGARDDDPRKILAKAYGYVETNQDKMDYALYRREGLPISSAPVESLIKQVNLRVKGTEKFWLEDGLEAVLQVRAAILSNDGRLEKFWSQRPKGRAAGKTCFKSKKTAA